MTVGRGTAGRGADPDGAKTIMLLDDDITTLLVLHAVLEPTRVRVIECEGEPCALHWVEERSTKIDLLVADVVLESSSGPAVADKVRPRQPRMKLLYISGFSLPELQRRGLLSTSEMRPGDVEFLQKPFSSEQFLDSVAKLLIQ